MQLGDVRTSSKDIPTLLHYIAAKAETEWPELNELQKDFEALPHACRGKGNIARALILRGIAPDPVLAPIKESLSQVISDLASLKKSVEFVGNQVKNPPATPDKFHNVMSEFYNKASQQVSMLETKLKKTEEAFAKMAEYYGEQPNTPAEQLFNTIWSAIQGLERAKAHIPATYAPSQRT